MDWIIDTSWADLGRTLSSGVLIYAIVVAAVRVNGLRTFAKMSGYDFAATVAVGSIIASVTITHNVPVLEGLVAVVAIVGSQRVLTELRRRTGLDKAVDNPAVLVVARGKILEHGMASTGLSHSDLRSTLRTSGVRSLADVTAVVFEPTGERSVITAPIEELDPALFDDIAGSEHLRLSSLNPPTPPPVATG